MLAVTPTRSLRSIAARGALLSLGLLAACSSDSDDDGGAAGNSNSAGSAMTSGGSGGGGGGGMAMAGSAGNSMAAAPGPGDPALNGISLPENVADWGVLAVHSRTDNGTLRMIVGNDLAVSAARAGDPYPDGTMIADLVWAGGSNPDAAEMIAPDSFTALLLMVKDSTQYTDSGGWGYANWGGLDLTPSDDPNFDQGCIDCHTDRAMGNDYVFTRPGPLPTAEQVLAAADAPNGLGVPAEILGWKMIGLTNRGGTVRAVIGNEAAVAAARAGEAYPDGAMIADFVWAEGDNPDFDAVLAPTAFNALILMEKDATAYADDGGWRYGVWSGPDLTPPDMEGFDQMCIDCHTDNAAGNDYVFTRPAELP